MSAAWTHKRVLIELGNDQNAVYDEKCDEKHLIYNHRRHMDNNIVKVAFSLKMKKCSRCSDDGHGDRNSLVDQRHRV